MALSPKQLRLVFAKLRAQGLLKYIKKSRSATAEAPSRFEEAGKDVLDSILSKGKMEWLLTRIPDRHKELSRVSEIRIVDQEVLGLEGTAGGYNIATGALFVSRSPVLYATRKGYSDRPLHVPRGSLLSKERYVRNAKVGAAKSFYHEYGHAIWDGGKLSGRIKRRFPVVGEWDGVERSEAFSEAYGAYAATKASRSRLKRERPLTHRFMRGFFEGEVDPWKSA